MSQGTRESEPTASGQSTTRKTLGGLIGLTIMIGLVLLWAPRLWFRFAGPARLREPALQTPTWMLALSIALIVVSALLMRSTWRLIKGALDE